MSEKEKLVIIGSGWGGYRLVYGVDYRKYDITIISPENTSTVTPLLALRPFPVHHGHHLVNPTTNPTRSHVSTQVQDQNIAWIIRDIMCTETV